MLLEPNPEKHKLVVLYEKMSDLTKGECANCKLPHNCCSPEYCEMAQEIAKEQWNTDISNLRTNHPKLPFMGPNGCICPPHFRPLCTLHTCDIMGWGFKPEDKEWTKKYFKLRDKISDLEFSIMELENDKS